jgi:hypothetical protein
MARRSTLAPLALLAFLFGCAHAADSAPVATVEACAAGDAAIGIDAACPADCDRCDDGVCQITCGPGAACERETVECAPGMDCEVTCVGDAACQSATIVGPAGFGLELECHGSASCGGVTVDAGLDVELTCDGAKACGSATLRCGSGDCDWACTTAGSCDGIAVQ